MTHLILRILKKGPFFPLFENFQDFKLIFCTFIINLFESKNWLLNLYEKILVKKTYLHFPGEVKV